ncbi:MAG: gamma-glutamyltransferase family protein [Spirulinaceae cyanobacterium]
MQHPDDDHYSPHSERRPLYGARAAVASSQPLASTAGLEMLLQGGNAVDAAVAMAIALTVLEPTANGIGGDAFALVWDGVLHGLNGSGRSPAAMHRDRYPDGQIPTHGWLTVTVPGAVSAWRRLWKRWGQLPFEALFEPAIRYAEIGFPVGPVTAQAWARAAASLLALQGPEYEPFQQLFFPAGRAPQAGDWWRSPGHAETLRAIAQQGSAAFYQGSLAEQIITFAEQTGGLLTADDLQAQQAEWVAPLSIDYRGVTVWEMPPNSQGLAALLALKILEGYDVNPENHNTWDAPENLHRQIEAMKLAFADVNAAIADPDTLTLDLEALLTADYAQVRRSLIQPNAALSQPEPGIPDSGTVYFCAADGDLMVSMIQSNYHDFGSGILIPDTGIVLQNRARGFTLQAGHANELAPNKRPFHTIMPGFLSRGEEPLGPFGVMGGQMQPQGHVQLVINLVDHQMNPQMALDQRRWRFLAGRQVLLEAGMTPSTVAALAALGHEVQVPNEPFHFGKGQVILRNPAGGVIAGSEPRADGCAIVL